MATNDNAKLRAALKEIEAHITATLAHQPDDDAKCGQLLYDALVKVFDIADMACHERRDLRKYNNAAKLREAAKHVQSIMERLHNPTDKNNAEFVSIWEIVSAALAAPPRQCDVGTAEEQDERFMYFCARYRQDKGPGAHCTKCPLDGRNGRFCQFAWAQLPYESEAQA